MKRLEPVQQWDATRREWNTRMVEIETQPMPEKTTRRPELGAGHFPVAELRARENPENETPVNDFEDPAVRRLRRERPAEADTIPDAPTASSVAEDVWHERRRDGIGGSEIGAILGYHPHETPLDVYLRKRGILAEKRETPAMRLGRRLKPIIAKEYQERTGATLEVPPSRTLVDDERSWHRGSPDYLRPDDKIGVQLKCASFRQARRWGAEGTDEVPPEVLLQCAWYTALLDYDGWDVALLVGGQDVRIYHVKRNRHLETLMLEQAERFWHQHVSEGSPPEPDLARDGATIAKLFATPSRELVDVSDDDEVAETVEELHALEKVWKGLRAESEKIRTDLKSRIGDRLGLRGHLPDGRAFELTWRPYKGSSYRVTRDPGRSFKLTVKELA